MNRLGKENSHSFRKPPRYSKSFSGQPPKFHFSFRNLPRELVITPKLIKDITGKSELGSITTLNLQFKDERFPKIREISGLEAATNLRTLNLSYNMIETIQGLNLPSLIELDLSENLIGVIESLVM